MSTPTPQPQAAGERLDLHNSSIDETAAAAGHCGMTDLHTGRVCQDPQDHSGSCSFVAAPATERRADPARAEAL
jgi:hypothetical protein